ncbi:MAG: hypothetical protein WAM91_03730 [Candidatus Acidiferrales bacterium]
MNPEEAFILVGDCVYDTKTDRIEVLHLFANAADVGIRDAKDKHDLQRFWKIG